MQIINSNLNNNYNKTPHFRSKFLETLKQPANLKKPLEKMSNGDSHCLMSYLYSLKFRLGINQQEIKDLLAKDGLEFLESAVTFFAKKLGFSKNNVPSVVLMNGTLGGAPAAYQPEHNVIYLTNMYETIPKTQLFGLLRHEFQHAIQNHNILRTENLGEEAVKFYVERSFNTQKDLLLKYAKNYSVRELLAQGLINQNWAFLVSKTSLALQNNDVQTLETLFNKLKMELFISLEDFRTNLIEEKGLINADSKKALVSREFFKEFKNIDYFNNGNLDLGKHATKFIEAEAEHAQIMAESEISQTCYIKILKNNLEKLSNNKEYLDAIDKELEKTHKN